MSSELILGNLGIYSIQIAALAATAALLLQGFGLRVPRAQLALWYLVLAACILLPVIQPWSHPPVQAAGEVDAFTSGAVPLNGTGNDHAWWPWNLGWAASLLLLLAAGTLLRAVLLIAGIFKLARLRRSAEPVSLAPSLQRAMTSARTHAEFRRSGDISGPVTFGFRRPVVLVPVGFFDLEPEEQESVALHELLHVRRRDWLLTLAEESLRALLWFHPAVWFVLNRVQLAREQVVDEAVVRTLRHADRYVGALLKIASASIQSDLAPAPLFLKRRHLHERVAAIVKGSTMSKNRLTLSTLAVFSLLPLVACILAWQLPLRAAPQEVRDAQGVEVRTGTVKVLHRTSIDYPAEARQKALSGDVIVTVTLNRDGEVADARVLSGPEELRKPVLQSVLNWHFSTDAVQLAPGDTRPAPQSFEVAVRFVAPSGPVAGGITQSFPPMAHNPVEIERIDYSNLSPSLRDRVESAMPLRVGEMLTPERLADAQKTLESIDRHLRVAGPLNNGKVVLRVMLAAPMGQAGAAAAPGRIRVGGNVQAANLVKKVTPAYPPEAKEARIQGTVKFEAIVGKDGQIENLQLISGHPALVTSAMESVKQWVYKPTLLNGNPVEVVTQIDVNYTLLP